MNSAFSLWQLGLGLLVTTVAFGFSVKAASRYSHSGFALLCASLGIEALAGLLAFLMFALDPGKFSFLLWASGILRYLGLGLLLAGWILLATSRNPIAERQEDATSSAPPMISGASFAGVLVVSGLAAAWALLLLFAAGMKTVPSFTSEEAFSAALPSLVLLPCAIGLTILSVRWSAGRVFVGLGLFSGVINLGCILIAIITYGSR
jgi:hypothetical protein